MELPKVFEGLNATSRSDEHLHSNLIRIFKGNEEALKVVAKSRHVTVIHLLHQFIVQRCSAAAVEDLVKHEKGSS